MRERNVTLDMPSPSYGGARPLRPAKPITARVWNKQSRLFFFYAITLYNAGADPKDPRLMNDTAQPPRPALDPPKEWGMRTNNWPRYRSIFATTC